MIITLVGAKTYSIAGKRFCKDIPIEVSSYIGNLAEKTGLFVIDGEWNDVILDLCGRPTIYYPETVEYDIMKQRPHHLLAQFASLGYFAVFVDKGAKEPIRQFGNLFVVSKAAQIRMDCKILYWTFPQHVALAQHFDYTIFDTIDFPDGAFHHWKQGYTESLESSNMVLASAQLLYDKAAEVNDNTHLVPNAVDYEMFNVAKDRLFPKPDRLDGRPVVGFYGALGVWIDTDLIVEACKKMPDYQFLIIGPTYGNPITKIPENMVKLDFTPYEELPRYLSWFDVGIIPFKEGDVSNACNPLKMWEYMSAGKPFVVTNLPEATLGTKATRETFVDKIRWAHENRSGAIEMQYASKNSWWSRVKDLPLPYKPVGLATSKDASTEVVVFMACSPSWFPHVEKQIYAMDQLCSKALRVIVLSDIRYTFPQYEHTKTICVDVSDSFNKEMPFGTNVEARYTKYTLYRLLIPKYLGHFDKAIYLDADTLVTCDLWELYNRDVKMIAGVTDTGAEAHKKDLGLQSYINAGVMLMNLKNLVDIGDKWLAMANSKEYRFNDQDIINLTCDIELLPARYNQSVCTPKDTGPGIIHYAGDKPWSGTFRSAIWDSVKYYSKIPKIIHYCWFGGNKKPKLVEQCIASWKEHCPDYTIIEWNESKINIGSHRYLKEAYASGKYAFVSDYVRLYALMEYGGIYMDSDYILYKNIDEFLEHRAFTGHETPEIPITAIMGAEAKHPWVEKLLRYYDTASFQVKPNTSFIPGLMERDYVSEGLYKNDVHVYPVETFCNFDHKKLQVITSEKAYGCHLFAGSWLNRKNV